MEDQKRPVLSLCMIVKDEEVFLAQCLESIKDAVDEIVIVDTGSEDTTVEIAKRYTENVYFLEWPGSFSAARNYALDHCTGEWILTMDADETLRREDVPLLKEVISKTDCNAVFFAVMNETPIGWTKHYSQRVFRNGKARYEGIVHNQLVYEGPALRTEITVYHYGYNLGPELMQKKFRRTEGLLLEQLADDKTNAFAYMNYVRVLKTQKKHDQVVAAGEKALAVCGARMNDPVRQMITYDMACSLIESGDAVRAETMARDLLAEFPANLDVTYALGHALIQQKRYEDAKAAFKRFLALEKEERENPKITLLIVDTYSLGHKVRAIIADCNYELGLYEEGTAAARRAIELEPEMAMYRITLARNLLQAGDAAAAARELAAMRPEKMDETVYLKYAGLCLKHPGMGDAAAIFKEGADRYPDAVQLHSHYANYLARTDMNAAAEVWRQILTKEPGQSNAAIGLFRAALHKGDPAEAQHYLALCIGSISNQRTLKELAADAVAHKEWKSAITVLHRYLELCDTDPGALADLATCYAQTGNFQAALAGYRRVLAADPQNETVAGNMKKMRAMLEHKND